MNFKKSLIIGASVLTLAPVASATFVSSRAYAAENNETQQEIKDKEYYENLGYTVYEFDNYEDLENHIHTNDIAKDETIITPYFSVSGGVIFVAGVAVGYIVDGVVINMSGQSVGEWVSDGIDGVINWFN